MYRGTQKTELSEKNLGAGSIITEGRDRYLVVAQGEKAVRLLNLGTFQLLDTTVQVEDPNFISKDETYTLIGGFGVLMSECDYDPKGMKEIKR